MTKKSKLFKRWPGQPVWYKDPFAYVSGIIGGLMMYLALILQ